MLRRPPTAISLSSRDVKEHLQHINLQQIHEQESVQQKQVQRLASVNLERESLTTPGKNLDNNEWNEVTVYEFGKANQQRMLRANATFAPTPPPGSVDGRIRDGSPHIDIHASLLANEDQAILDEFESVIDPCINSGTSNNLVPVDQADSSDVPKAPSLTSHRDSPEQSSQATGHTFDYGGFEVSADQSSSFVPQDMSNPRNNDTPDARRHHYRVPLPRSPLFRTLGANSPERRLTVSLTPRVASYRISDLQPARRPRSYRPRTISYSFEESDRASATYEQVQGSDNDSIGSQPPPELGRGLQEEQDGGSWQSASLESNVPSSPPVFPETSLSRRGRAIQAMEERQTFGSSSPQLPLPPPFSAVPRNLSLVASLPSVLRNPSGSSPRYDAPRLQASPVTRSSISSPEEGEENISLGSSSILRSLAALPFRLFSAYRSRSPFQSRFDASGSRNLSPTPRGSRGSRGRTPEEPPPTSARGQFRIYDDAIPASIQPQTPQHLPEARHQSRLHPSYTAPASLTTESPGPAQLNTGRRRGTRSDSPLGLETPGFRGLYGGQENADEEVMFDRAAQRLWALGSARRHGRSMSGTPDREPSFADNRGELR